MSSEKLSDRIKHLQGIVSTIDQCSYNEHYFDKLYEILESEYQLEGGNNAEYVMGNYRHNLEQTMNKQARTYIYYKKKRPVKGAPNEYKSFVSNFRQDVSNELSLSEYKLKKNENE